MKALYKILTTKKGSSRQADIKEDKTSTLLAPVESTISQLQQCP